MEALVQYLHKKQGDARGWRAKHVRYFDISKLSIFRYIETYDISIYRNLRHFDISKLTIFRYIETFDTISNYPKYNMAGNLRHTPAQHDTSSRPAGKTAPDIFLVAMVGIPRSQNGLRAQSQGAHENKPGGKGFETSKTKVRT